MPAHTYFGTIPDNVRIPGGCDACDAYQTIDKSEAQGEESQASQQVANQRTKGREGHLFRPFVIPDPTATPWDSPPGPDLRPPRRHRGER